VTAEFVFSVANTTALLSWIGLAFAVWRRNNWLRDQFFGRFVPLALAMLYALLIVLFFGKGQGGFDRLSNVKMLFTFDWLALAGWVHYLAFDLFVGTWIARQVMEIGVSRLWLIGLLPLTFMFGPAGFLAFEAVKLITRPTVPQSI
jgi:phosphoglycerol transferase MdoB-like AlkP superfamily enzyme